MRIKKFLREGVGKGVLAAVSAVAVLALVVLNLLLTQLGAKNQLYIDLTPEEFYTVSDTMKTHTKAILDSLERKGEKIKITFCTDPDYLTAAQSLRMPYFLALGLEIAFPDRIEVETVNVAYNPTAVSKYKANSMTQISSSDIIVSYGDRYRIFGANSMWVSDTEGNLYSFNGEYKLASIIMSVTAKELPVAYFVTNHGEVYYDASDKSRPENAEAQELYNLLSERGLDVKLLDLSTKDIPDDCVLLIINNPQSDFCNDKISDAEDSALEYVSETEKLDRYLVMEQGAIMVAKDPSVKLHNFDLFLYEWGFDISDSIVRDDEYNMHGSNEKIIGAYDTDEESYGMAIYESYASMPSAPSMIFNKTGYIGCSYGPGMSKNEPGTYITSRNYAPLFYSSGVAKAYRDVDGDGYDDPFYDAKEQGRMDIAGVTTRLEIDQVTAEYKFSYLFCSPSAETFSNELLGNGSYANYEILSALVENISRVDRYASLELGGTSFNSSNLGGKPFLDVNMYADPTLEVNPETGLEEVVIQGLSETAKTAHTVILMLVPAGVLVLGIVVRLKRRFR